MSVLTKTRRMSEVAGPLKDVDPVSDGPRHHRHRHSLGRPRQGQVEAVEERPHISLRARGHGPRGLRQHGQHC